MSDESKTPGEIEREFRHELGSVNPYLCLTDSAVNLLLEEAKSSQNETKYLKSMAGKYGHYNLYTAHLELQELQRFVHFSHIALINSKAESACEKIQGIKFMLGEAKSIAQGDFLRKTIAVIHASKENAPNLAKSIDEKTFSTYIGEEELKIIDYFRRIRNNEFHSDNEKNSEKILVIFKSINQDSIKEKYKLNLNTPENIEYKDVLLLSKIWQASIKHLCAKCLNTNSVYEYLLDRYKGISNEQRRKSKIIKTIKLDYLQNDEQIDIIMHKVG